MSGGWSGWENGLSLPQANSSIYTDALVSPGIYNHGEQRGHFADEEMEALRGT